MNQDSATEPPRSSSIGMKTAIVVPGRLASTRFPEKLLHTIRGKPLVLWTAERIRAEAPEIPLFFAVDDSRLAAVLEAAGFETLLTDPDHPSGTDRIAEANRTLRADVVINVQGDEPLVSGEQIRALAALMVDDVSMGTLARPFRGEAELRDPNRVKVVVDGGGRALYFSRSPIPYFRDTRGAFEGAGRHPFHPLLHLGLYAYRARLLESFAAWKPTPLELSERLEMLRVLEHGHRIAVGLTEAPMIAVDTPEDAAVFEDYLRARGGRPV